MATLKYFLPAIAIAMFAFALSLDQTKIPEVAWNENPAISDTETVNPMSEMLNGDNGPDNDGPDGPDSPIWPYNSSSGMGPVIAMSVATITRPI